MTWQSAARGGFLRTLRRGAPRTGVSDLQHQLSRASLTANSGAMRPQAQPLTTIHSLFQSNSFATASTASKTPKAKSSKKAGTKAKKPPLTEEQQENRRIKQLRAHIRELKATALLHPPKRLPTSAYTLALAEKLREIKGQYPVKEAFLIGVKHSTSLNPQDEERLRAEAKVNIAANTAAYDAWVKSHTPLQIKEANTARLSLSRLVDKNYPPIKDDRLPKLPRSAYLLYLGDRSDTVDYQGKSGQQTFTAIAHEWNELPQSEKERYHQLQIEDRERYDREYEEVYGVPAPPKGRQSPEASLST